MPLLIPASAARQYNILRMWISLFVPDYSYTYYTMTCQCAAYFFNCNCYPNYQHYVSMAQTHVLENNGKVTGFGNGLDAEGLQLFPVVYLRGRTYIYCRFQQTTRNKSLGYPSKEAMVWCYHQRRLRTNWLLFGLLLLFAVFIILYVHKCDKVCVHTPDVQPEEDW